MTGSARDERKPSGPPPALLTGTVADALRTTAGRAAGVYLRSSSSEMLRLAVLSGLPGQLFRPWWRVNVDRPFPVADVYRTGVPVVLANATEVMRRYPQFAAGLPFQFGSLHVPVVAQDQAFGVLTVLRAAAADAAEVQAEGDRLSAVADALGADLLRLGADGGTVTWDDAPLCVRPPAAGPAPGRVGRLSWTPATNALAVDAQARALLGLPPGDFPGTLDALSTAVDPADAHRLPDLLRRTALGRPPPLPIQVRTAGGGLRLLDLWRATDAEAASVDPAAEARWHAVRTGEAREHGRASPPSRRPERARAAGEAREAPQSGAPAASDGGGASASPDAPHPVAGVVLDPGPGALADGAADLLPEGVFCLDRTGLVVYANPRAGHLLGVPRELLVGRPLWEAVPWLNQPTYEEHLRGVLLSPEPAHFDVRLPAAPERPAAPRPYEGDWLRMSLYPGADLVTCKAVPADRVPHDDVPEAAGPDGPAPDAAASTAPLYRPIVLAIALTEAVTARQVSAVVMQELLPAFGGRRLAIYLLQERHLYLAWESGFPEGFLAPFEGVALDARLPGVETLTTGRPLFFDSMQQLADAYPGIELDAEEGARAFLPLIASGRPVGSCILGFDRSRSFGSKERTVLTALAGLIAHAMEKAQRYDTEAALARGLQQALLPRRLSQHARVETAGRYLPGTEGMDVGGDWYDVVESGDGLALVIGDVQGHGVQAAATMGQLRSAVRAFALGDRPPDEVMGGTNHLLIDLDPGQFASCCYVRLDPSTGRARAARAGHLPPLLRHPDGRTEVLELPGGVVLGVDPRAHYPVTELLLEPGAILALYTDGLVERPGHDIDDGIAELRRALAEAGGAQGRPSEGDPATSAQATGPAGSAGPTGSVGGAGRSLADVADRLTAAARRSADRFDDIALLLATRRGPAGAGPEPPRRV
ncbi:SpoIIE family protein phosphatase [Streptomyces sp. NBC_00199]|uniref:SpoIIE family protein phosphatase n=1 Tax=Streptomyces sp. NBC_00199 TaxID=2975678 RepID=UPI00224CB9EC|nr:SpoIIE family protein phosphatase [Streptomyces sp. NBC_00199]MCX5262959.1 SpoIIE family protein phosphatase [Streptomyces sp. NBC_00199]